MSGLENLIGDDDYDDIGLEPIRLPEDYSFEDELEEVCNSIVTFADYLGEDDIITVFADKSTLTGKILEINDFILVLETNANPETHFIAIDKISCIKLIESGVEQ